MPERPHRTVGLATLALVILAGRAPAQDQIRNFRQPILMVETEGHRAPVRALIWPDAASLLSGGLDKVVRAWDVREGRPTRSIRPLIWRGPAGTIYAMALSPRPDRDGQRLLAVAGYGIQAARGDMTVFRYPGLDRSTTGDPVARLSGRDPANPRSIGHSNSVMALAFDPTGRFLASGSLAGHDPADQNLILWDAATLRPIRALTGQPGSVLTLAFTPDGRLATAGSDGHVRLWDVNRGVLLDAQAIHPTRPSPINTLAIAPDGVALVVGTEHGALIRFDARSLRVPFAALPVGAARGPVEAVAFHPNGRLLAASVKADMKGVLESNGVLACDLEIRSMPAGAVAQSRRVPGLVHAVAFRPDGAVLAYSGGSSQAIVLQDPADLRRPPILELKGQGARIFDVGFTRDSQTVGFTRDAPGGPPPFYQGFDLGRRTLRAISADQLTGSIKQFGGWSIREDFAAFRLEAVHADGRRRPLDIDAVRERNWWSYTFVPPGPGHDRATVAIGTEAGVVVYDLETGRRTRMYAGPIAAVTALSPSPDGRWLASGSIDQAVMLYPLAGSDRRPPFGATFRRQGDALTVAEIAPRGFAEAMGLQAGDVVLEGGIGATAYRTAKDLDAFAAKLDEVKPNDQVGIRVRRLVSDEFFGDAEFVLPPMPSTKRDNPALTLLAGQDREWVLWTPMGYYDTSIEGDSRLLGWHLNPAESAIRPTDFVPIGTYAAKMRRPAVLDRLWQTGDPSQAIAALPPGTPSPVQVAEQEQPPKIVIAPADPATRLPAPGLTWVVNTPTPRLNVTISSQGKSPIASRRLILDERALDRPPLAAPLPELRETIAMPSPLTPNQPARLMVKAANASGSPRSEFVDLVYTPAPGVPVQGGLSARPPRLVVVSFGPDPFASGLPSVRFAAEDADALADHFRAHLIPHAGSRPFEARPEDRVVLSGKDASAESIARAFDRLRAMVEKKELDRGDLVCVVIASHVLDFDKDALILAADTASSTPPAPAPSAHWLGEQLGELSDYGCRTVLFLDGVHELNDKTLKSGVKEWVRDLQQNRNVVTFVASKEGPSAADARERHGLFALGLLHAFRASGAAGARADRAAPYTLGQFRAAVVQDVLAMSRRQQEVGCYVPLSVSLKTWFARP